MLYYLLHSKAKKTWNVTPHGHLKTHIFWAIGFPNYDFTRRKFTELCFQFRRNRVIIMCETHSALHQEIKSFAINLFYLLSFIYMYQNITCGIAHCGKTKISLCFSVTKLLANQIYLVFYLRQALLITYILAYGALYLYFNLNLRIATRSTY